MYLEIKSLTSKVLIQLSRNGGLAWTDVADMISFIPTRSSLHYNADEQRRINACMQVSMLNMYTEQRGKEGLC